jgi:hypothetical protein
MAEVLASAALFGAVSGAVIGVATGRAVNRTLDAAYDMATQTFRAISNLDDFRTIFPEIFQELDELDVDARLRVVFSLIKAADRETAPEAVKIALSEVRDAIDNITSELKLIHEEFRAHQERWFASFRSPRVKGLIANLRIKMSILDRRVELLIKSQVFLETLQQSGLFPVQHQQQQPQSTNNNNNENKKNGM